MDSQEELLLKLGTFLQLPRSEQVRMTKEILENQETIQRLETRIKWVRRELEKIDTTERSSNLQWLLQHLTTLQTGEFEKDFQLTSSTGGSSNE